jgi:hypothetical protein
MGLLTHRSPRAADRRKRAAFGCALVTCTPLLAVACGSRSAPSARQVPWVNRTVPRYEVPVSKVIPYPVSAPACRAGELRVSQRRSRVAAGRLYERLVFNNVGERACLLRGYPTITGVAANGVRSPLMAPRTGLGASELVPSDMRAGGHSFLDLATSNACGGRTNKPTIYRRLEIAAPGVGTIHAAANVEITKICALYASSFGLPARYTPVAPTPGTVGSLWASVQIPQTVRVGRVLTYTITLSNRTRTPVTLTLCPGYTEGVYEVGFHVRRSLALNCATVHTISPRHRVSFAMELSVPARTPSGQAKFDWSLNTPNGPSAGRIITVRPSG